MSRVSNLSPFNRWLRHKSAWKDCQKCPLGQCRENIVLLRGSVPAEILFVGEAPGVSEDALGKPFCGPAGHKLDEIIEMALSEHARRPTLALTNLIACIPLGEDGNKTEEPPQQSIVACAPRLQEIVHIVNPKLIVMVGQLSAKWCPKLIKDFQQYHSIEIIHPAAILRQDPVRQPLSIKRAVIVLSDAVHDLLS